MAIQSLLPGTRAGTELEVLLRRQQELMEKCEKNQAELQQLRVEATDLQKELAVRSVVSCATEESLMWAAAAVKATAELQQMKKEMAALGGSSTSNADGDASRLRTERAAGETATGTSTHGDLSVPMSKEGQEQGHGDQGVVHVLQPTAEDTKEVADSGNGIENRKKKKRKNKKRNRSKKRNGSRKRNPKGTAGAEQMTNDKLSKGAVGKVTDVHVTEHRETVEDSDTDSKEEEEDTFNFSKSSARGLANEDTSKRKDINNGASKAREGQHDLENATDEAVGDHGGHRNDPDATRVAPEFWTQVEKDPDLDADNPDLSDGRDQAKDKEINDSPRDMPAVRQEAETTAGREVAAKEAESVIDLPAAENEDENSVLDASQRKEDNANDGTSSQNMTDIGLGRGDTAKEKEKSIDITDSFSSLIGDEAADKVLSPIAANAEAKTFRALVEAATCPDQEGNNVNKRSTPKPGGDIPEMEDRDGGLAGIRPLVEVGELDDDEFHRRAKVYLDEPEDEENDPLGGDGMGGEPEDVVPSSQVPYHSKPVSKQVAELLKLRTNIRTPVQLKRPRKGQPASQPAKKAKKIDKDGTAGTGHISASLPAAARQEKAGLSQGASASQMTIDDTERGEESEITQGSSSQQVRSERGPDGPVKRSQGRGRTSKKKTGRLTEVQVRSLFSDLTDRIGTGVKITEPEKKLYIDLIFDTIASFDAGSMEQYYIVGANEGTEALEQVLNIAEEAGTIFVEVEDKAKIQSGLISCVIAPNVHVVLGMCEERGLKMEKHGDLLQRLFYSDRIMKFCADVKETKASLMMLVPPKAGYKDGGEFLAIQHLVRQWPQTTVDTAMEASQRVPLLMRNLLNATAKGIRCNIRQDLNAKKKGLTRDKAYTKRFFRKDGKKHQIQNFSMNKFGEPSDGGVVAVPVGGRFVAVARPNAKKVEQEGRAAMGDVEHVSHRHLWPVFCDPIHVEADGAANILLERPLQLFKVCAFTCMTLYNAQTSSGVYTFSALKKMMKKVAESLHHDLEVTKFSRDPLASQRAPDEHMESQRFLFLGKRRMATTWLGVESVSATGYKVLSEPVFGQDLVSLTSNEPVEIKVVDIYAKVAEEWGCLHNSKLYLTKIATFKQAHEVFGKQALEYCKLQSVFNKEKVLIDSKDAFEDLWTTWPIEASWIFPIATTANVRGRKPGKEPLAVFAIVISFHGFPKVESTQDVVEEIRKRKNGEAMSCSIHVSLEETVESNMIEILPEWQKEGYLRFARDLLRFVSEPFEWKVDVVVRSHTEPQEIPPLSVKGDPGDLLVVACVWLRNRAICRRVDDPEDFAKLSEFVDFERDLKEEDVAHVLLFSEIIKQELAWIDEEQVENLKKSLISGKFFPAAIYPPNPGSYRWKVSELPPVQGKYPPMEGTIVANMRSNRMASLRAGDQLPGLTRKR